MYSNTIQYLLHSLANRAVACSPFFRDLPVRQSLEDTQPDQLAIPGVIQGIEHALESEPAAPLCASGRSQSNRPQSARRRAFHRWNRRAAKRSATRCLAGPAYAGSYHRASCSHRRVSWFGGARLEKEAQSRRRLRRHGNPGCQSARESRCFGLGQKRFREAMPVGAGAGPVSANRDGPSHATTPTRRRRRLWPARLSDESHPKTCPPNIQDTKRWRVQKKINSITIIRSPFTEVRTTDRRFGFLDDFLIELDRTPRPLPQSRWKVKRSHGRQ